MGAKELVLRPLPSKVAREFICRHHYSHKTTQNPQWNLGVYWQGQLAGAMQFGPSIVKRNLIGLVTNTSWHGFLELNRLVFLDKLPRNSESRAIRVALRLLGKHRPVVEWVVSFADACFCGDGTIYRASGFVLTDIRPDRGIAVDDAGHMHHKMTYDGNPVRTGYLAVTGGKRNWPKFVKANGWRHAVGFQLRYIYFLNPAARARLTVPEIPFSEIAKRGAGMYKGRARSDTSEPKGLDTPGNQPGEGGAAPTLALSSAGQA